MHHITEDTPPDMLAGAMDLSVRLPDGQEVNMAVERSTPMMDLLVQVTTAYKLRPSDHIIQAMDMNVEHGKERVLPYKPNSPIGALDTQRVRVLPKNRTPAPKAPAPSGHQPFESTFRLQVHLPRNQFCVIRVGKHVLLEDIMRRVCEEKNLDPRKFEFRHPANIDKVLDPKRTLNDYEITEITVVHRGSSMSRAISSSDIMVLQREDERRKLQAKTGGGVLNLIFRRGRTSMGSGSISSDTRSISPTQSDDSRSVTPPAVQPPKILPSVPQETKTSPSRPKAPQRKRRPAPKPPAPTLHQSKVDSTVPPVATTTPLIREVASQLEEEQCQTDEMTKETNGLTICHSRNSSDSSGYHEASILSDNCNTTTLPRRPKSTILNNTSSLASSTNSVDKSTDFSKSTENLTNMSAQSKSTMSLTNAGRKKKAPPPPPSSGSVSNLNTVNNTPVVASSPRPRSDPKPTPSDSQCPPTPSDVTSLPRSSITSLQTDLSLQSVPEVLYQPQNTSIIETPLLVDQPINDHRTTAIANPGTILPKSSSVEENKSTLLIVNPVKKINEPLKESQNKMNVEPELKNPRNSNEENNRRSKENGDQTFIDSRESPLKESKSNEMQNISIKSEFIKENHSSSMENFKKSQVKKEFNSQENKVKSPIQIIPNESAPKLLDTQRVEQINISVGIPKIEPEETNDLEEWQYTLPSPPTAFRDDSPTNFTDMTNYDTVTFNGMTTTDSVVTSPALFDKQGSVKNSETETIISENESTTSSKQPELLASKYLSLESLEKRKSLVLERELTNLAQNENNKNDLNNVRTQKNNMITEIEEVFQGNKKNTNLSRTNSQSREKILSTIDTDSTLPNFKMSTYEQPKMKINIFEDDSIRSNVESANNSKRNSVVETIKSEFDNSSRRNSLISGSNENVYAMKSSDNFLFKKPQDFPRYKSHSTVTSIMNEKPKEVSRSESFTHKNGWSRLNPVKRSKSHISLERWKDEEKNEETEDGLHKSNSLFNVAGLQSLEVMRLILPKLGNTPPSTPIEDPKPEPLPSPPKVEPAIPKPESPEVKKYQYRGPPAINLSTWSERPKSNVSLKEDRDYKINNIKSIFSSAPEPISKVETTNTTQSISSVNIRVEPRDQVDSGKINIKINSDPISHQSNGNVVIKIGENNNSDRNNTEKVLPRKDNGFYSRFLNQTQATGYRKPLGNINGVSDKPRPHSIAFDASCPDLSRVPIVRAVELKKPFKDGNKSVTQIIHDLPSDLTRNEEFLRRNTQNGEFLPKSSTLGAQNRHSSVYLSSENLAKPEQIKPLSVFPKPIARGNSFASRINMPTVKGFRMPADNDKTTTWGNDRYGTLPNITSQSKIPDTQSTFTQNHLKRMEPSKVIENESPYSKNHLKHVEHPKTIVNGTSFSQNALKPKENDAPFSFKHLKRVEAPLQRPQQEKPFFENVTLRSTTKVSPVSAPPPPQMPKIVTAVTKKPMQRQRQIEVDPRDQLLDSIRNFGGKAGLRAAK